MGILNRAELLLQAKNYSGSGGWLDESGNSHNAQFGSIAGADTNDPEWLPHDGVDYVRLPGVAGNFASAGPVNLADCDTAHIFQSIGRWDNAPSGATRTVTPVAAAGTWSGYAAAYTATAATGVRLRCGFTSDWDVIPVVAGNTYSFATNLYLERAGTTSYIIRWVDAVGGVFGATFPGYVAHAGGWAIASLIGEVAPVGAVWGYIELRVEGNQVGDSLMVGESMVAEGTDATFVPSPNIVGDLEGETKASLDDWTPAANQYLMSKASAYALYVDTAGKLVLNYYDESSTSRTATSTVATGVTDGDSAVIGWSLEWGAGVKFYVDGVQLGTTVSETGTSLDRSADGLRVGQAAANPLTGSVFYSKVMDGVGGPVVAHFAASDFGEPFATADDVVGNVWTINRSGSGLYVVDRPAFGLHTDDYLEVANHADLNFAATDPLTIMAMFRKGATPTGDDFLVAKKSSTTTGAGYSLFVDDTPQDVSFKIGDNSVGIESSVLTVADRYCAVAAGVRNIVDDDLTAFSDGTPSGSPTSDTTTGTLESLQPFRIGARSNGLLQFFDGEIMAIALFREALTDGEIVAAGEALLGAGSLTWALLDRRPSVHVGAIR